MRRILLPLILLALLAGCTKEMVPTLDTDLSGDRRLRFGLPKVSELRAPKDSIPDFTEHLVPGSVSGADTLHIGVIREALPALTEEEVRLRAAANEGTTFSHDAAIKVYGFEDVTSTFSNAKGRPASFMNGEVITYDAAKDRWVTRDPYYWSGSTAETYFRFLALFPADLPVTVSGMSPSYTYTVPAAVADQKDVLFAYTGLTDSTPYYTGVSDPDVPLTFRHLFVPIKLKVGTHWPDGSIKSIRLLNIQSAGTFAFATGMWGSIGTPAAFTTGTDKPVTNGAVTDFNVGATTLMMLPQTLDDNAAIEVTYSFDKNGDGTKTDVVYTQKLKAITGNGTWEPQTSYTYLIDNTTLESGYHIFVDKATVTKDFAGGMESLQVRSFFGYDDTRAGGALTFANAPERVKESRAVPWKLQYKGTDNQWHDWPTVADPDQGGALIPKMLEYPDENDYFAVPYLTLRSGVPGGAGKVHNQSEELKLKVYFSKPDITPGTPRDALSRETPKGDPDNPYDLSTAGGTELMTTANCYIVTAPGVYKLPLVYGNAIKNGSPNEIAYTLGASVPVPEYKFGLPAAQQANITQYFLKTFPNYLGKAISSPYIYTDLASYGKTLKDAILVYTDNFGLVLPRENVYLSSDKTCLIFKTEPENLGEGNAIVAVRDQSGAIVWSWHIWFSAPGTNEAGNDVRFKSLEGPERDYYFKPRNLGAADGEDLSFPASELQCRVVQTVTGGASAEFAIKRTAKPDFVSFDSGMLYQWGRKDPMMGWRQGNLPSLPTPHYPGQYVNMLDPLVQARDSQLDAVNKISAVDDAGLYFVTNFDNGATRLTSSSTRNQTSRPISFSIKNPNVMVLEYNVPDKTSYWYFWFKQATAQPEGAGGKYLFNLWNNNIQTEDGYYAHPRKTVYDPSPRGYLAPVRYAFSSIRKTNTATVIPIGEANNDFPLRQFTGTDGDKITFAYRFFRERFGGIGWNVYVSYPSSTAKWNTVNYITNLFIDMVNVDFNGETYPSATNPTLEYYMPVKAMPMKAMREE